MYSHSERIVRRIPRFRASHHCQPLSLPFSPHLAVTLHGYLLARIRPGIRVGAERVAVDTRRNEHAVLLTREVEAELLLVRGVQTAGSVAGPASTVVLAAGRVDARSRDGALVVEGIRVAHVAAATGLRDHLAVLVARGRRCAVGLAIITFLPVVDETIAAEVLGVARGIIRVALLLAVAPAVAAWCAIGGAVVTL